MPDLFGWYTPPAGSQYNLGLASFTDDPYQVKTMRPQLQQAGLWNPAWDAWFNDQEGVVPTPDLSALAGYKVGGGDYGGGNRRADLVGPDGRVVVDNPYFYDEPSMGESLAEGALIVGGAALGMNALFGGLGGAAAGSGVSSLPSTIGESLSQVAPLSQMGPAAMSTLGEAAAVGGTAAGASALPAGSVAGTGLQTIEVAAPAWGSGVGTLPATVGESLGTVASIPTNAAAGITPMAGGSSFGWDSILKGLANGGARSLFDIGSGLYGMSLARDAAKASDPFAQYRGFYGEQLQALEQNPGSITSRPGWRAGLEGVDRQMAARGYYGSGNMDAARTRYAGDFYGQEMQRLAGLAGAGQTPGAGQFPAAQLTGQGLASIGYGLAPWVGGRPA